MPKGGRTPTAILKANGGYRTNEHPDRLDADLTLPVLREIDGLEPPEEEIYQDLVTTMPEGVLGGLDTTLVRLALDANKYYRRARAQYEQSECQDNKALRAMIDTGNQYIKLAKELGLSPNGRAAMKAPVKKAEDGVIAVLARVSDDH